MPNDDRPPRDLMLWHIAFWFVLSLSLLSAFFVRYGSAFLEAMSEFFVEPRGGMPGL